MPAVTVVLEQPIETFWTTRDRLAVTGRRRTIHKQEVVVAGRWWGVAMNVVRFDEYIEAKGRAGFALTPRAVANMGY